MLGCFLCLEFVDVCVSANICADSGGYHDASSLQKNLVPISQCLLLIFEGSCYRTISWCFSSYSLDGECEETVFHLSSVFHLASGCHVTAQHPPTVDLLLEICGDGYIYDEMFSSNLNVVLWLLAWPLLESRVLFIFVYEWPYFMPNALSRRQGKYSGPSVEQPHMLFPSGIRFLWNYCECLQQWQLEVFYPSFLLFFLRFPASITEAVTPAVLEGPSFYFHGPRTFRKTCSLQEDSGIPLLAHCNSCIWICHETMKMEWKHFLTF